MERNLQAEIVELGIECCMCVFNDICDEQVQCDCIADASNMAMANSLN